MRTSLWNLRLPTLRLPTTGQTWERSSHLLLGALAGVGWRYCLCATAGVAHPCALIKPLWKTPLSSMTERSEDDAEQSENDDYSRAFVGLGSQRKALPLQLASGEGFGLQKAGSGEPKPWLETCLPHFTQAWPRGQPLAGWPGSQTRLPGGLLTSGTLPSQWFGCRVAPILGLAKLLATSGHPADGLWAALAS